MSLLSLSALETTAILEVPPLVLVSFLLLRFWGLLLPEITTRRTKIFLKNQVLQQVSLYPYFRFPQEQSAALDVHRKLSVGWLSSLPLAFQKAEDTQVFLFLFFFL